MAAAADLDTSGGEGRFCSGIDHAAWVIVGSAVQGDASPPEPRFFLVPRSEVEIVDDWFTSGMRGTGSRTIRIADVFIPAHRSVSAREMAEGVSPGAAFHSAPLYQMPFNDIAPFSIAGAPLGMALGAVRLFSEGLKTRYAQATDLGLADDSATLARVAAASAQVDAAIALVISSARMIDDASAPEDLSAMDRARIPRDWAYAVQTARKAVNDIFEVAGGSGIYNNSEIQRVWRDINAGAQHVAFGWDRAMVNFGRSLAGHAPLAFQAKR